VRRQDKNAVVYGAAGSMGGAVARANEIRAAGGTADTAAVDAGRLDSSCNTSSSTAVQNLPLGELSLEEFMTPIIEAARTHVSTATAAAKPMTGHGSG
jgi:3-oxoacyl-[acyl-carrier protein] reductase